MTPRQALYGGAAWLCCAVLSAQAQAPGVSAPVSERQQLQRQREAIESRYQQEVQQCYQVFAVNDCKQAALLEQREGLKAIRAQERALDATERAHKAQAQKERVASRLSEQAQAQAAQSRSQAIQRQQNVEQKHLEKNQAHAQRAQLPGPDRPDRAASRPTPEQTSAAQQSHDRKLQQAAEHRAANAQQRQDRTKPLAAPLPVPKDLPQGNPP